MESKFLFQLSIAELQDIIRQTVSEALSPYPVGNQYMTRKEVCDMLNISLPTLHRWVRDGKLTCHNAGAKKALFLRGDVLNLPKCKLMLKLKKN